MVNPDSKFFADEQIIYHLFQDINGQRYAEAKPCLSLIADFGKSLFPKSTATYQKNVSPWLNGSYDFHEIACVDGNPGSFLKLGYNRIGEFHLRDMEEGIKLSFSFFYHVARRQKDVCIQTYSKQIDARNYNFYQMIVQPFMRGDIESEYLEEEIYRHYPDHYSEHCETEDDYSEEEHDKDEEYAEEGDEWKPEGWQPDYPDGPGNDQ